ncbi:cell wall elongation regulator TseB-like domain-containing protein [Isobaculum melis]|uniref:Uncharacterized protein YpmB n=1 Tax=Isobaculum melis TaxID=142588 RepID=A0A1H9R973_9LACT|nr:DUF5590 domain-containing protein [Isobaculum melis]SER69157.1 Uncharacterized protein YpmB [Isobaculum melis]
MKKWLLISITSVVTIACIIFFAVYSTARAPKANAEEETIALAKKHADLDTVDDFYWYNGKESYFTVTGKDTSGEAIVVIVAKNNGKMTVLKQSDGITEAQARGVLTHEKAPAKILTTRMGMKDNTPIWEMSYEDENGQLGYYSITFKDGTWVEDVSNI